MTNVIRLPYLSVSVNGVAITNVLAARTQLGYSLAVAQAEVEVQTMPTIKPWDAVVITMGGTQATASVRFTGYFISHEPQLYEKTYKLICKGKLCRAETYKATTDVDMSSYAVGIVTGHHDETMVATILYIVGLITGPISGETVPAAIGGTGNFLGTSVASGNGSPFSWDTGTSGLSFIQRLDEVCLGYRTFDKADGTIVRELISTTPAVSPDFTFTEHVDIYQATATDTVIEACNRIVVTGWNPDGKEANEKKYTVDAANPYLILPTADHPEGEQWYAQHTLASAIIEKKLTADSGSGLSCEAVANWLLAEKNRRMIHGTLITPRDDLVSPGQTIAVASSTRLGFSQNFWVQQVDTEINRANQFSQAFTFIGERAFGDSTYGTVLTNTASATSAAVVPTVAAGASVDGVTSTATAEAIAPAVSGT